MENQNVPKPDSHLALAILTTILCCLPLGIVAIIKATKVDTYYANRQYNEAIQAAEEAKKWSYWGIGLSVVGIVLYILFLVFCVVMASLNA